MKLASFLPPLNNIDFVFSQAKVYTYNVEVIVKPVFEATPKQ